MENTDSMFERYESLVNIENHFTSEKLKDTEFMFNECVSLEKIDLSQIAGEVLISQFYVWRMWKFEFDWYE